MRKKAINALCVLYLILGILGFFWLYEPLWGIFDRFPFLLSITSFGIITWPLIPLFIIVCFLNNYRKPISKIIIVNLIIFGFIASFAFSQLLFRIE